MPSIFDELREGFRDGINIIVKKTEQYTKLGKIHIDLISIRHEIEQLFSELGGRTYELLSKDPSYAVADDEEVKQLVVKLKELEEKLAAKKKEKIDHQKKDQSNG